ncbi:MAG: dihydroorotate dehydrogenase electron transfer subunit [Syntrophomonas sp.]|nr:dihydroorotate dehydrogenase electron transfer subunit [Syntrophomonas sp.]
MPLQENGLVINHQQVAQDMYIMEFMAPAVARECQPGQFLHVRPGNTNDPLLRRPLSIYDADQEKGSISLLYRVVGAGTSLMTGIRENDYIDIVGPLGRGFTLPAPSKTALLVGGGVGIAPLVYLGRALIQRGCQVTAMMGAANENQLVAGDRLLEIGVPFLPVTMDGSRGYPGMVTDLLVPPVYPEEIVIYTCGPEPMMAKVAEYAQRYDIWGEVSLEEHMACGVGACLGCARRLKANDEAYVKVCKDGPVFNIMDVEF